MRPGSTHRPRLDTEVIGLKDRLSLGSLIVVACVAAALAGGCSRGPQPETRIPAAALRPTPQDTLPHMQFARFRQVYIREPGHGSCIWVGLREGSAEGAEPNCNVIMTWAAGICLAPVNWGPLGAPGAIRPAPDAIEPGTPSGRAIGDHALHFRTPDDPRLGVASLEVARGPATARVHATVHGGTEAAAVSVAEQLAQEFCERVDRALEYIGAQNHRLKLNGATVWCRQVPGGALVGDVKAFCDALDGEVVASTDGVTVVLHAEGHDVWLDVGLTTAEIGKATTTLSFPTLQWGDESHIADLSGLARLVGAGLRQ